MCDVVIGLAWNTGDCRAVSCQSSHDRDCGAWRIGSPSGAGARVQVELFVTGRP